MAEPVLDMGILLAEHRNVSNNEKQPPALCSPLPFRATVATLEMETSLWKTRLPRNGLRRERGKLHASVFGLL